MACQYRFDFHVPQYAGDDTGLFTNSDVSQDGIIEYLGYSLSPTDSPGAGGNWPWTTNVYGAVVSPNNLTPGFYHFKYRSQLTETDVCYGETIFNIAVTQGTSNNLALVQNLCATDAPVNIFQASGLPPIAQSNGAHDTIGGDTDSPGYVPAADVHDAMFDPSLLTSYPAFVEFTFYRETQHPSGYTPNGLCVSCGSKLYYVSFYVTETFDTGTLNKQSPCNNGL